MVLGDAEETVTTVEIDEETYEEVYKTTKRTIPMLFVRGDGVILGKRMKDIGSFIITDNDRLSDFNTMDTDCDSPLSQRAILMTFQFISLKCVQFFFLF